MEKGIVVMRVFVGLLFVFLLLSGCGAGGAPDRPALKSGELFFNVAA